MDIQKARFRFSKNSVVLTVWEMDFIPAEWSRYLSEAAEVWVPSKFNLDVFQYQLPVPVFQLPHPVSCFLPPSGNDMWPTLGINEEDFLFYSILAWQRRKNPLGIIQAFLDAFPTESDVVLLLKVASTFYDEASIQDSVARLAAQSTSKARIKLITTAWTDQLISDLHSRGDCYVSLHRAEGWCYPLFDAACRGVPVIATAYSAPREYLNPIDHNLVDYRLVRLQKPWRLYTSDMQWADPDLGHASRLMRLVYLNREISKERAVKASADLRCRYSQQLLGASAKGRLEALAVRSREI